jgi:uncharacterized damage-inducible protein DinB
MSAILSQLARYKRWADALMLADIAALPEEEALRERPTRWTNMVRTMNHILVVDDIFRAHLTGGSHDYVERNTAVTPTLAELSAATAALDTWYVDYAGALQAGKADEIVRFAFLDGGEGAMTRGEMILHVVNHATYHRGLVSDMMYQAGRVPSTNDLPVYLRDAAGR